MARALFLLPLGLILSVAGCDCSDGGTPGDSGTSPDAADTGMTVDSTVPVDSGIPDSGGPRDGSTSDGSVDGSTDASMPGEVRFIVMGDVGEGNTAQREVAVVIRDLCAAEGCDFVVLLGDNIYDAGVDSVTDPQWMTKFEDPYRDVDLPFYAVLGNHDYGGCAVENPITGDCISEQGGLGNEWDVGAIEVAYTAESMKWEMPATYYTFQFENVGFVALDTNSILWDDTTHGDQWAWWSTALSDLATADWIITLGHHPYLSNGAHGNAGTYESIEVGGVDIPIPIPILDGANVQSFFETNICGTADVSFSGHDHNRQWIDEPGACVGTELIVSGAGAKTKDFDDTERNGTHFQNAIEEGFMYVIIDGDTFIGRWVDRTGATEFERMFTRR
jgi:3',5'-cyclic AMP phosphodiesterase CpdA